VHSPAGSGAGTPTRVKSPDATATGAPPIHDAHEEEDDGSDSTSRRPGSAGGSITSVD
jgi:hypothetical protein